MTENEIINGNKKIAMFWGSIEKYDSNINGNYWTFNEEWYDTFNDVCCGTQWITGNFKFHKSWNWIIPIIDKIENLDMSDQHYKWIAHDGERSNFINYEFEMKQWSDGYSSCISMDLQLDPSETVAGDYYKKYPTRIDAVWNCVVEFIDYYNKTYLTE